MLEHVERWQKSCKGWVVWSGACISTGYQLEPTSTVVVSDVMSGFDARPCRSLGHVANAKLLFLMLRIAHGHNETVEAFTRFPVHKEVKPKVMVGAIVHSVVPHPCAALD